MEWYTIIFIASLTLFLVKCVVSWVFGDIDLDIDFDGDSDFDTSSAFSFKGLVHFLLGFSSYLVLRAQTEISNNLNDIIEFNILDYILAVICGIILTIILFFAYKLVMKAKHEPDDIMDLVDNCKGTIYLNLGNGQYSIQAHTKSGTINVTASNDEITFNPGSEVILKKNGNKITFKLC